MIPIPIQPTQLQQRVREFGLNSIEFRNALDQSREEITSSINPDSTEATISGAFERVLYGVLRDIGIRFNPQKEESISIRRHTAHGRMDSRLGAVVIEYKRPSLLRTSTQIQSAINQLSEYLSSLTREIHTNAYGFLTNGYQYLEFIFNDGIMVSCTNIHDLDQRGLFQLARNIHSLELTALTPENLIRDFCGNNGDGVLFEFSRGLFSILNSTTSPKTVMLRNEWEEIFRLGHNDQSQQQRIIDRRSSLSGIIRSPLSNAEDEYRALFSLHTSYALVIKLIAYKVVSSLHFTRSVSITRWNDLMISESEPLRVFFSGLEDGDKFRTLGILNLLEGDFFSWYSDINQWNPEIYQEIKNILSVLSRYEDTSQVFSSNIALDLFKDLYEAAIPQAVRSSFGEFYTPKWLAEHVIDSTNPTGEWRLLDPCSGSGTFLITAIEKIKTINNGLSNQLILEKIIHRVVGLDLNPLAVLTARVNYFVHISDLLPDTPQEIIIPVFLGDSSNVPNKTLVNGVECIHYSLHTIQNNIDVTLPVSIIKNTATFVKIMLNFELSIKNRNPERASSIIIEQIPEHERTGEIIPLIHSFSSQLVELEIRQWNGIWARILSNFLTTAALDPFDIIVGNPPWIDWKNLPEGYRDRIKGLCIDRGLFSGDGRTGGINLNICALISHVCINNWLKPEGKLAFLMPKELAVQQSYQGWRRLAGEYQKYFQLFIDWSFSGHPFDPVKEDFMTYVIGSENLGNSISVIGFKKNPRDRTKARNWENVNDALSHLQANTTIAGQIIPNSTSYTFANDINELNDFRMIAGESQYIGREGIEFYPQELLIFKYTSSLDNQRVYLRNIQVQRSKYRVPPQNRLMETRYLFPLIKGSDIEPFHYDDKNYIVPFPYIADYPHQPITSTSLSDQSPLLLEFYRQNERIIRSQTGFSDVIRGENAGEFYGLARTGVYSFAEHYVCFRDNTKWCSVVVSNKQMPWGETKRYVFQNHAVSVCERADGGFISEDEAHYICAIYNVPTVQRFIYASSDNRSFKIRPPVYLPLYNPSDQRHVRLSSISRIAHQHYEDIQDMMREAEGIYLLLCMGNPH